MHCKVTLDTNILISGFLFDGICKDILNLGITGKIQVFTSKPIIDEFRTILETKIKKEYHINTTVIEDAVAIYLNFSGIVMVSDKPRKNYTPNNGDNFVIDTALISDSTYLVTGDHKHILGKVKMPQLEIMSPADFMKTMK